MQSFVYIMGNDRPTLYLGVTNDIQRRTFEHRNHLVPGFTKKYRHTKLLWYEIHEDITEAITREKQIKEWNRDWKLELITAANPGWKDLYDQLFE